MRDSPVREFRRGNIGRRVGLSQEEHPGNSFEIPQLREPFKVLKAFIGVVQSNAFGCLCRKYDDMGSHARSLEDMEEWALWP